jgi:MSHA biogenesis protein MshP
MNRQRGFGAIAAIVILVILAVLGAAIVSIGTTQQMTSAQDVMSAKAWQTARAGNEWGLYKALKGQDWGGAGTLCDTASRTATLDLRAETGFAVTITCDSWGYNEGESVPGTPRQVRMFRIRAVACPAAACPVTNSTVAAAGYVERTRVVLATN